MKTVRSALISALSLLAVLAVFFACLTVMRRIPVPIDRSDIDFVDQMYENDIYFLTVSPKAGGLYCTGCNFRTEGDVLYITVTGSVSPSDPRAETVRFAYRCPDVTTVKYEYKWSKESEKSVVYQIPQ